MESDSPKDVIWVASSLDDLREFPESVRQSMGFAIFQAQCGGKHVQTKPLKGFKGSVATPQRELDVIKSRLKMAERIHESRTSKKEGK